MIAIGGGDGVLGHWLRCAGIGPHVGAGVGAEDKRIAQSSIPDRRQCAEATSVADQLRAIYDLLLDQSANETQVYHAIDRTEYVKPDCVNNRSTFIRQKLCVASWARVGQVNSPFMDVCCELVGKVPGHKRS